MLFSSVSQTSCSQTLRGVVSLNLSSLSLQGNLLHFSTVTLVLKTSQASYIKRMSHSDSRSFCVCIFYSTLQNGHISLVFYTNLPQKKLDIDKSVGSCLVRKAAFELLTAVRDSNRDIVQYPQLLQWIARTGAV